MQEHNTFIRDDVMPSWWANAIQKFLSVIVANFTIEQADATTVRVPAGADEDAVVVTIDGKWRWNEADTSRSHPGGAAGEYVIWAVANANSIVNTPLPGTDTTDYSFTLRITDGTAPSGAGTALAREVGKCHWDGAAITSIYDVIGGVTIPTEDGWAVPANYSELRTIDARSLTLHNLADYVATLEERILRSNLGAVAA